MTACTAHTPAGERRPTGTEPGAGTEPALWAVRSTGWLDDCCGPCVLLQTCSRQVIVVKTPGGQHALKCPRKRPSGSYCRRSDCRRCQIAVANDRAARAGSATMSDSPT